MSKTKIDWCNYSINPVKGLCPEGCEFCYARRMYRRFKWDPALRYDVKCFNDLFGAAPGRVFVGSTMELFGPWIQQNWMENIWANVSNHPAFTFIFLTKRPENLQRWSPFPDNCWVGATTHTAWSYDQAIEHLQHVEARLKFLSFEPLCDRIDIHSKQLERAGIRWVILGRETPISNKVHLPWQWFSEVVEAADNATPHIPVFLKRNLRSILPLPAKIFCSIHPSGVRGLRQEFPK